MKKVTESGINYELQVDSYWRRDKVVTINVSAVMDHDFDSGYIQYRCENDNFDFSDEEIYYEEVEDALNSVDFTDIEKIVDRMAMEEASKGLSNICANKTNKHQYWKFSIGHRPKFGATVLVFEMGKNVPTKVLDSFVLNSYEEVINYIDSHE